MPDNNAMRTPLKNVRRLGSAKDGTGHFWQQRLTAVANLFLSILLVGVLLTIVGQDHEAVRKSLARPYVALPLLLLVISGVVHMRLGMQVIIEDYVSSESKKIILLILNTFFASAVCAACVFAVLKISFVGA